LIGGLNIWHFEPWNQSDGKEEVGLWIAGAWSKREEREPNKERLNKRAETMSPEKFS
jgi:hypothetical protein